MFKSLQILQGFSASVKSTTISVETKFELCKNVYCTKSLCNGPCCPLSHFNEWNNTRVPAGFTIKFDCAPGQALRGNNSISCLKEGYWSSAVMPQCFTMIDQNYKRKSKIKYSIVLSSVGIMCAIFIYNNAANLLSLKTRVSFVE